MAFASDAQGSDVNIVEQENNTSLLHAVKSNLHESGVFALIDAGADVNELDDERKTPLFYAVQGDKENVVRVLIEKGKASVNARDIFGRTPLFYAMTKSQTLIHYLLDKKASINFKDNCNVSILSFFIENCMSNYSSLASQMSEGINLLIGRGVKRRTVFETLINVVFCKSLFLFTCGIDLKTVSLIMELAKTYVTEEKYQKESMIDDILEMMRETGNDRTLCTTIIPNILDSLFEIGAEPNSADSDGNTALHYATRLPFYGVSQETVIGILRQLESFGVMFNAKNHKNETCLLFCLSEDVWELACKDNQLSEIKKVVEICKFLLERGSSVDQTSLCGKSIFHLILELVQHLLILQDISGVNDVLNEAINIFQVLSHVNIIHKEVTVNRKDFHFNSPLHLWASLQPTFYNSSIILSTILKHLLECGAKLNVKNKNDETPLHLCRTWTAVKLLIDAGANPKDVDSSGRSPLLVAAKSKTFLDKPGSFYPDVSQEPKEFWETALKKGLDPWTVDKDGESVLSILIRSEASNLATTLVEVACNLGNDLKSYHLILFSLLKAICKDRSTHTHWKNDVVERILKSTRCPVNGNKIENSPLHFCCRNITETSKDLSVDEVKTTVHWTIAKQLLSYGADCRILDATDKSCLDIADASPALKDLLMKPIALFIDKIPLLITNWKSVSKRYEHNLAKVARHLESKHVEPFWYHQDNLQNGSFGVVFAGINEKDGREVAIKRIERVRMRRREDKREIENLALLADCEQVVRYLCFFEDEHFSYIVLELMEGNLEEFLDNTLELETKVQLCQDVLTGLEYLHSENILHRDLKPTNILFKAHPRLCLKIADFGLSRCIDSTGSTSNVGTRSWIAPEVLKSTNDHSKSSDVFACGLLLHYILSVKRHPFVPDDSANKSLSQITETENNIMGDEMKGWDNSLCPEAAELVKKMLSSDKSIRPGADEALSHPLFWSKKKKTNLLFAVGNQPEFVCPRAKRPTPLTAVETDLERNFETIVKYVTWNDPRYVHMPAIYAETKKKRKYKTNSVVELVRFIRNTIANTSSDNRPTPIRKHVLEDFVFLEYFPNLVMEVYKAVTTHRWDQREEIKYNLN